MDTLTVDIRLVKSKPLYFTIQITHQKYRGYVADFTASNGFRFTSAYCPAITGINSTGGGFSGRGVLFLRGDSTSEDNYVLRSYSIGYIEKLKVAVKEYNIDKR